MAIAHEERSPDRSGWSSGFRRCDVAPDVFVVSASRRDRVLQWAARQMVSRAGRRPVHAPSVDAWAVLDGGIVHLYGYGLTSLPGGVYIVGRAALRLVRAELGPVSLDDPLTPLLPGAAPYPAASPEQAAPTELDQLRRRHRADDPDDPVRIEQAELLASCTDAVMLRWVATTLLAEQPASTRP